MIDQSDIIYFLLIDRFYDGDQQNNYEVDKANPWAYHGGDFKGIIEKIPYLKNLGITTIWISPVYVNISLPAKNQWGYHGYWTLDFERIDYHWCTPKVGKRGGGREFLRNLVSVLHQNKIKLVLDIVINHTGYEHPAVKGEKSRKIKPHWFNPPGRSSPQEQYLSGLPDLDHDQVEVADFFINNILDWIEKTGVDGLRMDAVKHVESSFWYHFKNYVRGRHPDISVIAEVLDMRIDYVSSFQRYFAFDSLFDFPLQQAIWDVFIYDKSFNLIARPRISEDEPKGVLDKDIFYSNHNKLITLVDNHDLSKRFFTAILEKFEGNKAEALKVFKMAMTFLLTTRGIPQIYYGTEIAMEGHKDPDNRRDMQWEVFEDKLEPSVKFPLEKEAFNHIKKLISIRRKTPALRYASLITLYSDSFVYAYLREFRGMHVIVIINNGHEPMPFPLTIEISENTNVPPRMSKNLEGKRFIDIINQNNNPLEVINGRIKVQLEGKTAAIYIDRIGIQF
jgi:alpha-amylase